MTIGYIGLGRMGYNMALRMIEYGHDVVAYNRSPQKTEKLIEQAGAKGVLDILEFETALTPQRIIWMMVPNKAVNDVITQLRAVLEPGDVLIDGGNTFYKDTIKRASHFEKLGVDYIDVGVSGGPEGARHGASLMVGGNKKTFEKLQPLFEDLATENGFAHMGRSGAGHFVKMIHNGIEYGMMQAIAEGFDILVHSDFDLNIKNVMRPYRNGSVIESELLNWLSDAYQNHGKKLEKISDVAHHTGEGEWTINTAKEMGIHAKIIEGALKARILSETEPNYQAQVISAMRGEFGGHPVLKENSDNKKALRDEKDKQ